MTVRSSPSRYSTLPHVSPHRVSFKRIATEGRLLRSFDNHLAYKFEFSDFWGDPSLLKIALKSHTALAAWAVHDGDVGPAFSAISAIPEPETYAMLLAGLGLVGFMARRRKDSAV